MKFIVGVLLVLAIFTPTSGWAEDFKYQEFLDKIYKEDMAEGSKSWNTWKQGLVEDRKFDLKRISVTVLVIEEVLKDDKMYIGFSLIIKAYCISLSGLKVTFIDKRMIVAVAKVGEISKENFEHLRILLQQTDIVDDWDGQKDI